MVLGFATFSKIKINTVFVDKLIIIVAVKSDRNFLLDSIKRQISPKR